MSSCRRCQEPIFWAMTSKGKSIPIDLRPVPNGNIRRTGRTAKSKIGTEMPVVEYVNPDQQSTVEGESFVSHFATCPFSAEFRHG